MPEYVCELMLGPVDPRVERMFYKTGLVIKVFKVMTDQSPTELSNRVNDLTKGQYEYLTPGYLYLATNSRVTLSS